MKIINSNEFLKKSCNILTQLTDNIVNKEDVKFTEFNPSSTVMIMVDIINGFIYEGALSDRNISEIILPVSELLKRCKDNAIDILAFADSHTENAAEFSSFPKHCIKGESESEIVDEIKKIGGYTLIEKNSTNGFHAQEFKKYINEHPEKNKFIVCGDCTDICVLNFCLCLKTWFNNKNTQSEIYVPLNMVETFDSDSHNGSFMNIAALKIMEDSGIKIIGGVVYE